MTNKPSKKNRQISGQTFTKDTRMASKHKKRCSTSWLLIQDTSKHQFKWLKIKRQIIPIDDELWNKRNCYTLWWEYKLIHPLCNCLEVFLKIKHILTI